MTSIDREFRQYGVEFFGEAAMANLTDEQIEEARVWAMNELADLTEKYGRQEKGTARELFCNYLFDKFI